MIRIHLPDPEARTLGQEFRRPADRALRGRLPMVLMAHRGRKRRDIAADLDVSPWTARR